MDRESQVCYEKGGRRVNFDNYTDEVNEWRRLVLQSRGIDAAQTLQYSRKIIAYGEQHNDAFLLGFGYYYSGETYFTLNDGSHFFETINRALSYLDQAEEWELMVAYMLAKHPGAFTEQSIAMARDFCERCWDRSNRASPMLEVEGEMDQVFVVVEQKQYRDLLQCVASLNTQSLRAKCKRFKPAECVEQSPRKWWQLAVKSVCWENARQRQNQGWKAFMEFKALRMEYIELYKRKNEKDAGVAARLAALEEKLSLENIVLFRKIAKEEMKVEGAKKEKEKKEKKKKGVWSRFFKKGSEEEEEEEPVWTEKTREELFSEFDIDESDVSPWEGGRPDDVQVTAQFKLNKLGVSLRTNGRAVLEMRFVQLATSVVKKKAFLQVFAALNDLSMEDESAEAGALRQVVYPEKNAVFDAAKLSVFVPSVLVTENETPFFP